MTKTNPKTKDQKDIRKGSKAAALSTQRYLQFAEVHDDVLVLKNGGLRAVLEVSSVNFNLKSDAEQMAIIQSYQKFLNALNFPVQILVKSRKLDIDHYIQDLQVREQKHTNELLKTQMGNYIEYVQKLVEFSDIMEKRFYVVIPYTPDRSETGNIFSNFLQYISPTDTVLDIMQRKREFKDLKQRLEGRVGTVKTALENCGLSTTQLTTEKMIELFYLSYNPDLARTQKFRSPEEMSLGDMPSEHLVADND